MLLFINEDSLTFLGQFSMRFILAKVIEILAHLVLQADHMVHVRVLVPLGLLISAIVVMAVLHLMV